MTQVPVALLGEATIPVELNEFSTVGAGHGGCDIGAARFDHHHLRCQIQTDRLEATGKVALLVACRDGDGEVEVLIQIGLHQTAVAQGPLPKAPRRKNASCSRSFE